MPRIRSFPGFIKSVILLAVIVAVIAVVLVTPFALTVREISLFGISVSPYALLTSPEAGIAFTMELIKTDFFKITVFPGFTYALLYAAFFGLWERKFIAKMQLRVGPQYAGRFEGILQPMADVLKLLGKELVVPGVVDRLFFWLVPVLSVLIATAPLAVLPVTEFWVITRSEVGIVIIFAALGFFPITALLAAWSSNSKYSLLGGLRALHQMVAYEIPLILSTLGVVILAGSLDLVNIVNAQRTYWFIAFVPIGAIMFYVCVLAELERIPYDLPEAEPEIVHGWLTEYGGMNFGLVFGIAVYLKLYVFSALFTILFLGGWFGPGFLPPEFWFIFKTFLVSTLLAAPRGIFPRIRVDLMLKLGWGRFLVLSIVNIFIAILVVQLGIIQPGGFK